MGNLVSNIKKMNLTSIIFSIIFIVLGFFLLLKPDGAIDFIAYVLGVLLIIWGVVLIIQYFTKKNDQQGFIQTSFVIGLLVFILGIVFLIKPKTIASIIPLLLGIWMIISGVLKLGYAITVNKQVKNIIPILLSLLIIGVGLFLVFNPFEGAEIITKAIGIIIIIYSILDIVECIFIRQLVSDIQTSVETAIVDAEYKEKDEEK
ncbi:MAG: DUF308 domain-containing protein [Bacilli bacterium]|nr:DUF308 domain-containing protein [Bacilli bacterium]